MLSYYQSNKVYLQLMLLMIAVPLIFWSDTQTFVNAWKSNATYNHGFFILPISLWLLYRQRKSISSMETAAEPLVLVILVFAMMLWFLSSIISVNVTQQFAVIALIPISIWILYGRKLLVKIIFPIAFLFFMIPVGSSLVPPLMEITADITVSMIELTGIPVFRDGLYFSLPTGNWSVIEACSGLNYLVASLTLGMLYSYLTYDSLKKRFLFVVAITLFSIIANGIRAYGIVIIGHLTNMNSGISGDHEFYGWLFYGFFVFWVFYIGGIWADKPFSNQLMATEYSLVRSGNSPITLFIIILSVMISVQTLARVTTQFDRLGQGSIDFNLPGNFGGWKYSPTTDLRWKPQIIGASITETRSYVFDNDIVQISLGYYPQQTQGSEAVSWQNKIIGTKSENWTVSGKEDLEIGDYYVTETVIFQQDKKMLIWNWYLVGDRETPNPNIAKIFDALNIVLYQRNDASFITLATPISINISDSRKKLETFRTEARQVLHGGLSNVYLEASK